MTQIGRACLKECAQFVMELNISRRMNAAQEKQKELLQRLRVNANLLESDVQKLLSLHMKNM